MFNYRYVSTMCKTKLDRKNFLLKRKYFSCQFCAVFNGNKKKQVASRICKIITSVRKWQVTKLLYLFVL